VEVGVLGPLRVLARDREIPVGGARERALLAALAVTPGEAQSAERLVDVLWGECPPPSAAKQLQNHVLRLRKALGSEAIRTTPAGYALGALTVDSSRFETGIREARVVAGRGAVCESVGSFSEALAAWRGRPFEELEDWAPAQAERARLEELRRSAEEDQIDARLACSTEPECVADLEALVVAEPLRERRWAQLMLALYRAGRQGAALHAYERARGPGP
jgi:DNA-binding SARP family transcriptional activator